MRNIKRLVIHASATPQNATIENIKKYWTDTLKWKSPGYHYIIKPDGSTTQLLDEALVSNGVAGYNSSSINVCYIGGIDAQGKAIDNRTAAQKKSLLILLVALKRKYPQAAILGHRDLSPDKNGNGIIEPFEWIKMCPCFDAQNEYKTL